MAEVGPIESGIPIPAKKAFVSQEDRLRLSEMKVARAGWYGA